MASGNTMKRSLFGALRDRLWNSKSRVVADGYRCLDPKRDPADLTQLDLNSCVNCFQKGLHIRLVAADGQDPGYMQYLGTDERPVSGAMIHRRHTHEISEFKKDTASHSSSR
jgi:hypothetical protein